MNKETYYAVRGNRSRGPYKRAAEFIYLNKACWNGLYRVNASGEFNVPYGRPKKNQSEDYPNLRECASKLARRAVTIANADFEHVLESATEGDFVFLDPPYVTRHNNNGFIDYNERLFSWADQRRLAATAQRLRNNGVHVLATNAAHKDVLKLYRNFDKYPFDRRSTLAADTRKRGMVREMIFSSRPR